MSDFQTALRFVQSTLRELHAQDVQLRASSRALARLVSAAPVERVLLSGRSAGDKRSAVRETPSAFLDQPPVADLSRSGGARSRKSARLDAIRQPILSCSKCPHLVRSRTQVVFGVGNPDAELMFVGEAPGEDEDRQGEPFVGKAGQLLTRIIETMGFPRESVYIANVLKCRPDMPPGASGNRKPRPDEMQTCLPYLREQIEIIQPRVVVALGATAMEGLLNETQPMARLRGRWHTFHDIPLMPTYHPAYLLRNQAPAEKRKVWEDMLLVLQRLGRKISQKQQNYFLPRE